MADLYKKVVGVPRSIVSRYRKCEETLGLVCPGNEVRHVLIALYGYRGDVTDYVCLTLQLQDNLIRGPATERDDDARCPKGLDLAGSSMRYSNPRYIVNRPGNAGDSFV